MKIYFTASIAAKSIDPQIDEIYRKIVERLQEMGNDVMSDHVIKLNEKFVNEVDDNYRMNYYKKMLQMINRADLVIAEVTHSSTSIGHEITLALEKNKPVIIVSLAGEVPQIFKAIKEDPNLYIFEYRDIDDLSNRLPEEIRQVKEGEDIRFNFLIPASMVDYLEWVSRNRRIPKSVFLRDLIKHEIEKDDEYLNR